MESTTNQKTNKPNRKKKMKIKQMKPWNLLAVTCVMAGIMPLTGFGQINVDFQDDTIGDPPQDALWITAGASVTVQDGESIFGGDGNQSMLMNTTSTGYAGNTWVVFNGDEAYTKGTFTTQLYGQNNLSFTYIRLGNSSTATGIPNGDTAVNLLIRWGERFQSWDAADNLYTFDQILSNSAVYTLVIDFDSENETWSGTINGSAITANAGAVSTFDYYRKNTNDVMDIDRVHFLGNSANNGGITYVNNLTLVPEPSTALIFSTSALLLGVRRVRKHSN